MVEKKSTWKGFANPLSAFSCVFTSFLSLRAEKTRSLAGFSLFSLSLKFCRFCGGLQNRVARRTRALHKKEREGILVVVGNKKSTQKKRSRGCVEKSRERGKSSSAGRKSKDKSRNRKTRQKKHNGTANQLEKGKEKTRRREKEKKRKTSTLPQNQTQASRPPLFISLLCARVQLQKTRDASREREKKGEKSSRWPCGC